MDRPIGVLAIQGDFAAHSDAIGLAGAAAVEVRTEAALDGVAGLVIPGGESTTITMGLASSGLDEAIRERHRDGMPVFGSCAGMIICDTQHLGLADYVCRRNAFGRQIRSFERDLEMSTLGPDPFRAVFIRAPWVESHGAGVEVLAEADGHPVAVRAERLLATAFHPELTGDVRIHELFLGICEGAGP